MYNLGLKNYNQDKECKRLTAGPGGVVVKRGMTLRQYRAVDLSLFALMLMAFETIAVSAGTRWFPGEPYMVSVTAAVTAIVMVRWGAWAGLHALLGGLITCLVSRAEGSQYLIYAIGNLLSLTALPLLRRPGWERIRREPLWTLGYGAATLVLMQTGRALLALLLGIPWQTALGFYTTDIVTLLFTLVILWIARRLDGVLEEQTHYLLRLQAEREAQMGGSQ